MEATLIEFDTNNKVPAVSKKRLRTGQVLSALAVLFLTFDGVNKVLHTTPVAEAFARMGYPDGVALGIGLLELACLAVYLVPRTAVVGAVLLTGFLGGAISSHVRIGDPFLSHTIFPVYIGALLWGGLFLRDRRVRALVSTKS